MGTNSRILIVEDSPNDREMFRRIISRAAPGLELRFAKDLEQARTLLKSMPISLVVLDNNLPDGYGADFLSEVQRATRRGEIPVLVVSDWPSPFLFAKAQASQALSVWSKDAFSVSAIRKLLSQLGISP